MKRISLILLVFALCSSFLTATVNSDVVGTWLCKTDTDTVVEFKLNLFEKDGRLYGKYIAKKTELIMHYIRILDDELRFQTETQGLKIKYRATVEGNEIKGTISTDDLTVNFTGLREDPAPQK